MSAKQEAGFAIGLRLVDSLPSAIESAERHADGGILDQKFAEKVAGSGHPLCVQLEVSTHVIDEAFGRTRNDFTAIHGEVPIDERGQRFDDIESSLDRQRDDNQNLNEALTLREVLDSFRSSDVAKRCYLGEMSVFDQPTYYYALDERLLEGLHHEGLLSAEKMADLKGVLKNQQLTPALVEYLISGGYLSEGAQEKMREAAAKQAGNWVGKSRPAGGKDSVPEVG